MIFGLWLFQLCVGDSTRYGKWEVIGIDCELMLCDHCFRRQYAYEKVVVMVHFVSHI